MSVLIQDDWNRSLRITNDVKGSVFYGHDCNFAGRMLQLSIWSLMWLANRRVKTPAIYFFQCTNVILKSRNRSSNALQEHKIDGKLK